MQDTLTPQTPVKALTHNHFFRQLFESSVEGMVVLDEHRTIVTVNPSCLKMFGYTEKELSNQPIEKLFPVGSQIFHERKDAAVIDSILDGVQKGQETVPVSLRISHTMIGTEQFVIAFLIDISVRIKAEQERIQFSRIFDESLSEIFILDAVTWKFLSVNKGALNHLGYTLSEMKEMTILDINPVMSKEDIEKVIYPLKSGIKDKVQFESVRIRRNGNTYPVEASFQLINFFSKKAFLLITMDISERKDVQQKLLNAIVSGQEVERKRIAKELHDGLGQYLSAANYNLDTLGFQVEGNEKMKKMVFNIRKIIENSIEELKTISKNLHPRVLENHGLSNAIEGLCRSVGTSNELIIETHIDHLDERLAQPLEIGLYRIAQELMNNIIKHSKAHNVHLQLVQHADSLLLLVEDDGIGFDSSLVDLRGFEGSGIRNITSQTKVLGGTYYFDSSQGNGTSVTIEIPLLQ